MSKTMCTKNSPKRSDSLLPESADSIYLNGTIYTVDRDFSTATAIAVKDGLILYVGSDYDALKYADDHTKIFDFQCQTVLPGLMEGHMHLPLLGNNLLRIDAFNKSKSQILALVKDAVENQKPGEWITGFGWNQELWSDKQFPSKYDLDAVAPHNPVVLERVDAHALWVNSKALEIGEIQRDTPDPQGGEFQRDSHGETTGILVDTAGIYVTTKMPEITDEQRKDGLLKAQTLLFKNGFTSIADAGSPCSAIDMIKALFKANQLKIRIYQMVGGNWGESPGSNATWYYKNGPEIGLYDNHYTIRAIKFFTDGSLGSRSAALLEDYSDRPNHKGNFKYSNEEFYELVNEARSYDWQIATHAIGDGAIRQVIDTYEKVLKESPHDDHRWRIEHFQIASAPDIARLIQVGILPAMQPTHAISDKSMVEERIGSERMKGAYAWRTVIDSGSILVGGSDAPVELVNPFYGIHAAVTRMDSEGRPPGGWYPDQKMTRSEAVRAFTIWTAVGQFEESIKGSLEVGKFADMVVIDRDILTCNEDAIRDTRVIATILAGETVYGGLNETSKIHT